MYHSMDQGELEKLFVVSALMGGADFYKSVDADFTSDVLTVEDIRKIYEVMEEMINDAGSVDVKSLQNILDEQLKVVLTTMLNNFASGNVLNKEDFLLASLELSQRRSQQTVTGIPFEPISLNDIVEVLGLTIKKDEVTKVITLLCMISAYTQDSQLNICFNAPSSTGKSYIPLEITTLFPDSDVISVAYCSPTAFFHDYGKYDKETNSFTVDLSRKILIFLDQPHSLLLQYLRPMLSHDEKEIHIKITDKSQKGGLKTKNITLIGFPSVIYCTAGLRMDEQEMTRFILLSPETNEAKIHLGIVEKIRKEVDKIAYKSELENNPLRKRFKERIEAIKNEKIMHINIESGAKLEEEFFKRYKKLKPRHQRDIGRIAGLIKVFALLNLWHRDRDKSTIISNKDDIVNAFSIWDSIFESQELNLPPYIWRLFKEVFLTAWKDKFQITAGSSSIEDIEIALSRQEIMSKHHEVYGRPLSEYQLRQDIIPMLSSAGLIYEEPDQHDRRKILIYLSNPPKNNSERDGGVDDETITT